MRGQGRCLKLGRTGDKFALPRQIALILDFCLYALTGAGSGRSSGSSQISPGLGQRFVLGRGQHGFKRVQVNIRAFQGFCQRLAHRQLGLGRILGQLVAGYTFFAQIFPETFGGFLFYAKRAPLFVAHKAKFTANTGQPRVGVVFAQQQPVLRARGEHAVGFLSAERHKIINKHRHIGLIPPRHKGGKTTHGARDVQRGPQALRCGFFVAGRAVDLPRKPQSRHGLGFKGGPQLDGVGVVVFNGVTGTQHHGVFQPFEGVNHVELHIEGQAGGNAVGIHLRAVEALRLQKNLVPLPVGETGHLVFNGRAVARASALDDAREHGRAVKTAADDFVRAFVCPRHMARHLFQSRAGAVKAEARRRRVARLFLKLRIVDG